MLIRNPELINSFTGGSACRGLMERKVTLALVQSSILMVLEGTNRATASEIAERAIRQYEIQATPSNVGQIFSMLGIGSVTTHGKRRFVLDPKQLEKIRENIEQQCHDLDLKLETSIKYFQVLPDRIQALEMRWEEIHKLIARENELKWMIQQSSQVTSRLYQLQEGAKRIQEQMKKADALEKECQELAQTLKKLPSLTERKKKLEARITAYKTDEGELAQQETNLQRTIEALKPRNGWVTLASLNEAIDRANHQLAAINREINRRRSLLDRILHRDEEA